jgi:peptidoglycan/xylan/chitin deacetylase (PgdA/CDA1 family)
MIKRTTTTCILVLLLLPVYNIASYASSKGGELCKCVIFRLDDVSDYYLKKVIMEVIKVFEEKNASLTIGLVGNYFGQDKALTSFIINRIQDSNTELTIANHGWNHEDFRRFNINDQSKLIARTNEKIYDILGVIPSTFIAPFDVFNNDTLRALKENGIKYISSFIHYDPGPYGIVKDGVPYHFPSTATTSNNNDTFWWGVNHTDTFKQIKNSIIQHGFAVVEMHPYEFSNKQHYTSKPFDVNDNKSKFSYIDNVKNWDGADINPTQIKELKLLIDEVHTKSYKIVSMENLNSKD